MLHVSYEKGRSEDIASFTQVGRKSRVLAHYIRILFRHKSLYLKLLRVLRFECCRFRRCGTEMNNMQPCLPNMCKLQNARPLHLLLHRGLCKSGLLYLFSASTSPPVPGPATATATAITMHCCHPPRDPTPYQPPSLS